LEGFFLLQKKGILVVGLICAVALSYRLFAGGYLGQPQTVPEKSVAPQDREVVQQDLQIKVTPQTEIVQKIKYTKCGDEEITREPASAKLVGMTAQQLCQVYQGWSVETFDRQEVVLVLQVDGYCKIHNDNMFVGIHNGYVAVFYGQPGPQALLKEETNIPLESVQTQDQEELTKGIIVKDRSELLQTLEGLQEHRR
jgi:hypothetical protein